MTTGKVLERGVPRKDSLLDLCGFVYTATQDRIQPNTVPEKIIHTGFNQSLSWDILYL